MSINKLAVRNLARGWSKTTKYDFEIEEDMVDPKGYAMPQLATIALVCDNKYGNNLHSNDESLDSKRPWPDERPKAPALKEGQLIVDTEMQSWLDKI